MKNRPVADESHPRLAVVSPITPGKLLDVPNIPEAVFAEWVRATGKNGNVVLTSKRRKCIEARIKEGYTTDDLLDAVRGWQHSAFHCGENDGGTVYNELTLLLRDGEHVERFRDLWQAGPPRRKGAQQTAAERFLERQRGREAR